MVAPFSTWNDDAKISVPVAIKKNRKFLSIRKAIIFADNNYFNLFLITWLAGSPKTSLRNPYQTVLKESNAKLYFPNLSPTQVVGKEIFLMTTIRATITGVVKDIKENTDFTFKTFMAYATLEKLL